MTHGRTGSSRVALAALLVFGATSAIADVGSERSTSTSVEILNACETYQVQPGDTLGAIAARIKVPGIGVSDLFATNKDVLGTPDLLRVGQVLKIPCHAGPEIVPELEQQDGPDLVIAPLWEASPGDDLVPVLVRWGREAGFDVVVERSADWRFGVSFRHSGSFRGAVDEVLAGFSTAAVPPYVTFYTNNVMTIGAR